MEELAVVLATAARLVSFEDCKSIVQVWFGG
jgi:hypothetical protein